ncbi:MAG: Uma2 family endonuclease [Pseudanabaena sp. M158S2SP1A06QC]|nr:Uma2 family endonuclease [Pseudanabaena sp. M158S2SP1A06QC]
MQATVTEQGQEPQMHLWSITDYHQMIEVGVLDEDDRVELLEGKIVCMSPQRPFHAASVQRSGRLLFKLLGDRAEIRIQLP